MAGEFRGGGDSTKKSRTQGEYTLVVAKTPTTLAYLSAEEIESELKTIMKGGVSKSPASRQLAQITSYSRREYQVALAIVLPVEPDNS